MSVRTLLSRLVGSKAAHSPERRIRPRFRPRLEGLEGREVPAGLYWTGDVSTAYSDVGNWHIDDLNASPRLPQAGDDVYFSATRGVVDGFAAMSMDGGFDPPPENNIDCVGFQGGQFRSVHLDRTYTGTVVLGGPVSTATLDMLRGNISQPAAGTDITVSQYTDPSSGAVYQGWFNWVAGVLNSSTNTATVSLVGNATTTISPGVGGILTTGSTLRFANNGIVGSTGTFTEGTVAFARGSNGLVVEDKCTVTIQPASDSLLVFKGVDPLQFPVLKKVQLKAGAKMGVLGSYSCDFPLSVEGGEFGVWDGATALFKGETGQQFASGSVVMTSGLIVIENGSTLNGQDKGLHLAGGKLATAIANQTVATIVGKLTTYAEVVISDPAFNPGFEFHQFATLKVEGDVEWRGGTFRPFVDAAVVNGMESKEADKWVCTGTFTVSVRADGGAKLGPIWVNEPVSIRSGRQWAFLRSDTAIVLQGNQPPFEVPNIWKIVNDAGAPVLEWRLQKL